MGAATVVATVEPSEPPSRGRRWVAFALGASLLVGGAIVAVALNSKPIASQAPLSPERATAPTQSTTTASTSVSKHRVEVSIGPAGAKVTIKGQSQKLIDEKLVLEGEAGDSFEVVVEAEGKRLEETVTITKRGTASPPELIVPVGSASSSPRPVVAASQKPRLSAPVPPASTSKPPPIVQPKPKTTGPTKTRYKPPDSW